MNCPKCGAEMKEGCLYCEKCGEEIKIVPDFEPEIEYSIKEILSGIVEDVRGEVTADPPRQESENKKRKRAKITVRLLLLVVFMATIGFTAFSYYRNNSLSYQLSKAQSCLADNNPYGAISYYARAAKLDQTDISICFSLADLYGSVKLNDLSMEVLYAIIQSEYATENEVETAYKKLIDIYKSKGDYESINTLIKNSGNETIQNTFQSYTAQVPEYSFAEGTYEEVIPLKLTASTQGTIYYTTDGSEPDENSFVYTTPIFLETGSYVISAIFVNEYGIVSDVVKKTYHIDVLKPTAPEVQTYSGEYTTPTLIEVVVPERCFVYYTTDGTVPTEQSAQYLTPIPMPLGKSSFKFITYSMEGVSSDCTIREFELELQTDVTPEMAIETLRSALIAKGRIVDQTGSLSGGLEGRYVYQFQYPVSVAGEGEFYVIDEIYEDTAGIQTKTGISYAVDTFTKEYFKLSRNAYGDFMISPIT